MGEGSIESPNIISVAPSPSYFVYFVFFFILHMCCIIRPITWWVGSDGIEV